MPSSSPVVSHPFDPAALADPWRKPPAAVAGRLAPEPAAAGPRPADAPPPEPPESSPGS
jgi:hypothetical protein